MTAERGTARHILAVAAWFGLLAGLVEGAEHLAFQELGWLGWALAARGVSIEIIWIAALINLILFVAAGLTMAAAAFWLPRLQLRRLAVPLFAFLAFFDWLALTGRIQLYAAALLAAGLAAALDRWVGGRDSRGERFCRRTLPAISAVTVLAFAGIQGGLWLRERLAVAALPAASPGSPNVLVIVVDTLRADHLSSYGYERRTTPHIDAIARAGVLFENACAASTWSPPSHASLVTGRYPHEHGVEWNHKLDGRYPTLAEALRARGYRTGAFSANRKWFSRRVGFGRGFIRFEDYFHSPGDMIVRTLYGHALVRLGLWRLGLGTRKWSPAVNQPFLRWVDRDRNHPYFAFLNYMDTHSPYEPPQPYRGKFSPLEKPGGFLESRESTDYLQITPAQVQEEIDAYDGAIAYADEQIGSLLSALGKRGVAENTLLAITSDHGESFGRHGMYFHRNGLYREVIQVPLLLRWPGHIPAGMRIERPVSNAALPATLMDLIGAGGEAPFPGSSLARLWRDPEATADWPLPLSEIARQPFAMLKHLPVYRGAMQSLVSPQWHFIRHETLGAELYDWKADPDELHNLAGKAEMQEVLLRFQTRLRGRLSSLPH